jgi:uncharacterized protein with HEPN domain
MKRDFGLYLSDMLSNIDDIAIYVYGIDFEGFSSDSKTVKAVIRSIEVIGEAAKNIPEAVRNLKPQIPWRDIARMRDKCIHFYFGEDNEIVWLTATKSIPDIRPLIQELLVLVQKDSACE